MNQRDAIHYIATRHEFTASALSGKEVRFTPRTGRLENQYAEKLVSDFNKMTALYVVYSYDTPIAWHSIEGWFVVSQKFSSTTSKHQNYVRQAVAESLQGAN